MPRLLCAQRELRAARYSVGAFFEMDSESERVALGQLVSEQAQALRSWGHERWTAILERRKTTAVEIELAAPRLLLPEDLSKPSASVRVLGRSDRVANPELKYPHGRSARPSSGPHSRRWRDPRLFRPCSAS